MDITVNARRLTQCVSTWLNPFSKKSSTRTPNQILELFKNMIGGIRNIRFHQGMHTSSFPQQYHFHHARKVFDLYSSQAHDHNMGRKWPKFIGEKKERTSYRIKWEKRKSNSQPEGCRRPKETAKNGIIVDVIWMYNIILTISCIYTEDELNRLEDYIVSDD